METTNQTRIEAAIEDVAALRRAMQQSRIERRDEHKVKADLVMMGAGFLIGAALLAWELVSGSMTLVMMASRVDAEIGALGLAQVAAVLSVLVLCIYFIVWRASKHDRRDFEAYLGRHFRYLNNLGLVSDLLTKFIPLSFLVLAGRPEWIAPCLTLYLADYLIQGRLFPVSITLALGSALVCLCIAVAQYALGWVGLAVPLAVFTVLCAMSVVEIRVRK